MKGISRTIYHGQPENCSGDRGAIQDGFFHRDLVIVLVHPTKDALHHFHSLWRVEVTISSGRRIFCERQRFRRTRLALVHHAPCAIHIHAANRNHTPRNFA
jgi:hypothetical protein